MSNNGKWEDATLTGWNTTLNADDIVSVLVRAVTGSASFGTVNVSLYLRRL